MDPAQGPFRMVTRPMPTFIVLQTLLCWVRRKTSPHLPICLVSPSTTNIEASDSDPSVTGRRSTCHQPFTAQTEPRFIQTSNQHHPPEITWQTSIFHFVLPVRHKTQHRQGQEARQMPSRPLDEREFGARRHRFLGEFRKPTLQIRIICKGILSVLY